MPKTVTFGKYYYASLFLAIICFVCAIISLGISTHADVYIKTDIEGSGSGSSYHEGRVNEATGFRNASSSYHYEGVQTPESISQVSEFIMEGGDGSYWNYHRTWTSKDIAGKNEMRISVGQIEGSYYGRNGMNISYNAAGDEEFVSTLRIEMENATVELDVINWKTGKPGTLEEIDRVGQFVIDQVVRLTSPIDDPEGWLDFCESLNRDVILSDENGIYVVPAGYTVDKNRKLVRLNSSLT